MAPPTREDVRQRLIEVAQAGEAITSTDLYGDPHVAHGRASSDLGKISLSDHLAGRPLLSKDEG